jgi:hypothetical protein
MGLIEMDMICGGTIDEVLTGKVLGEMGTMLKGLIVMVSEETVMTETDMIGRDSMQTATTGKVLVEMVLMP